ncbi:MAG: asparaginase [Gammaproteobacteria bacterium]|nr:asparaginase [Gammaproteobacteria bacterium]
MSQRICVLYVGGTIGMSASAGGLVPSKVDGDGIMQLLQMAAIDTSGLSIVALGNPIDSADATPADWTRIARRIAELYNDYDGFIVLHGTDTMAYTASALSFLLRGLKKPVVLTGAQIPLAQSTSDGPANLIAAYRVAASAQVHEVVVCFGRYVLRGNRSRKLNAHRFDAFDSPNFPRLAEIGESISWNAESLLPCPDKERFELVDYRAGAVLSWRLMPGAAGDALIERLARPPRALILESYGAGTGPTRDPALLRAIAHAVADGSICVAISQCPWSEVDLALYATGRAYATAGVIGARDLTFESVYAKLHHLLALGLKPDAVRRELLLARAGELTA